MVKSYVLKNRQSAAKFRIGEGSTTIPLEGSTPQAIGGGSGQTLTRYGEGQDIVCAYMKV